MRHIVYGHLKVKILLKYLELLTKAVEKQISSTFPEKFAITFDCWTEKNAYYVSIFATYPCSNSPSGYDSACLGFSPLENMESLYAL